MEGQEASHHCSLIKVSCAPAWCLSWLGHHSSTKKVVSLIPSQDIYLGCRFQSGCIYMGGNQLMLRSLSLASSLPLSLSKFILGWGFKKKWWYCLPIHYDMCVRASPSFSGCPQTLFLGFLGAFHPISIPSSTGLNLDQLSALLPFAASSIGLWECLDMRPRWV